MVPPAARFALPVTVALCVATWVACWQPVPAEAAIRMHRNQVHGDSVRTTMDGVYTLAQATKGKDLFAMRCQSCHTPAQHTGPPFRNKWFGRSLGELYAYIKREMPKNEPRSLTDQEYVLALAFLLRMNGMPTGSVPLAADSSAMQRIRLDSVRTGP